MKNDSRNTTLQEKLNQLPPKVRKRVIDSVNEEIDQYLKTMKVGKDEKQANKDQ